jgi:outer membrane protein
MLARVFFTALFWALLVPGLGAQESASPWSFRLRAVISGSSHASEPAGYEVYSGVALSAAVVRHLGDRFSAELSFHTESREVTGPDTLGASGPLGSLEMIPLSVLVRWHPRGGGADLQPYVGLGGSFTATWEKSGALDSSNLAPHLGPAIQLGSDVALSPAVLLNLDVKWNTLSVDVDDFVPTPPSVQIDPLTFGLGLGFRF